VEVTINAIDGSTEIPAASFPLVLDTTSYSANRVLNSSGNWEITSDGTGFDTSGSNDSTYMLADDIVTGDFDAWVQLVSLSGPSGSRMGLMLRDGTGAGAEFIAIGSGTGDGYKFQERDGSGGANAETDATEGSSHSFANGKWVLVQRAGDTVTVAVDNDNNTYTLETTVDITGWSDTLHVGLFVHSGTAGINAVGEFDGYTVTTAPEALSYNFTGFNNDAVPVQQQQVDGAETLGVEPVSGWVNFDLPSGDSDETFTDGNVSLIASNISGGGGAKSFQILPDTSDPNTDMLAAGWSIGGSTTLELTGLPSEAKDVYLYLGAAGGNGLRNSDIRLTGSNYGSTTYFAALSQGGGAGDGPTTNNSTTGYPGVGFVQVNSTDSGNRMDGNYILWQGVTDTSITITFPSDKFLGVTGIQIISE